MIREMTPAPSTATSIVSNSDLDELMHDVFEFSDVEVEEPMHEQTRETRSQSRMKEPSVPPAEPKLTKVRRGAKKVDAEAVKKPRRRRVIREEPIEIDNNTDDE